MKKRVRNLIPVIALAFICLTGFSLSAQSIVEVELGKTNNEWTLYHSESGVNFYYKHINCDDPANGLYQESIVIRIENTNNKSVDVSFNSKLWYDGAMTQDGTNPENEVNLQIAANDDIFGECGQHGVNELKIFIGFTDKEDVSRLTSFALTNITVK